MNRGIPYIKIYWLAIVALAYIQFYTWLVSPFARQVQPGGDVGKALWSMLEKFNEAVSGSSIPDLSANELGLLAYVMVAVAVFAVAFLAKPKFAAALSGFGTLLSAGLILDLGTAALPGAYRYLMATILLFGIFVWKALWYKPDTVLAEGAANSLGAKTKILMSYIAAASFILLFVFVGGVSIQKAHRSISMTDREKLTEFTKQLKAGFFVVAALSPPSASSNLPFLNRKDREAIKSWAKSSPKIGDRTFPLGVSMGAMLGTAIVLSDDGKDKVTQYMAQNKASFPLSLGDYFSRDDGICENYGGPPVCRELAEKYYLEAASYGSADAMYDLSLFYKKLPVPNLIESRNWTIKAAESAHPVAQLELSRLYEAGAIAPSGDNKVAALMLSMLAASRNAEGAAQRVEQLLAKVTPEQRAEAEQLVSEWKIGESISSFLLRSAAIRAIRAL
jgi:hypothetical protein